VEDGASIAAELVAVSTEMAVDAIVEVDTVISISISIVYLSTRE